VRTCGIKKKIFSRKPDFGQNHEIGESFSPLKRQTDSFLYKRCPLIGGFITSFFNLSIIQRTYCICAPRNVETSATHSAIWFQHHVNIRPACEDWLDCSGVSTQFRKKRRIRIWTVSILW